jgi:hypothetical protein
MTKYTIKDVTNDLSFLLTLTKLFTSDDKGFWMDEEERFEYKLDNNSDGKQIVIFQDPMPRGDYFYFNPFSEGFGKKSPAVNLFYKTCRVALNVNIRMVMLHVLEELLNSKEQEGYSLAPTVLRMSTIPLDKKTTLFDMVDEKFIDEVKTILDRLEATEINGSICVVYIPQQMTANVKCDALTDPKWDENHGHNIRKKSLLGFKSLLMGVLGIKNVEELDAFSEKYDPALKSSAKIHSTLTVYLKLYSKFNEVLSESDAIDLGTLAEVIDRFPLAYAIAKHMIQPSVPAKSITDVTTTDTSNFINKTAGTKRFLQPEVVDSFGRPIGQVGIAQPLFTPGGSTSRFKPEVVGMNNHDPFSPIPAGVGSQPVSVFNQPTHSPMGLGGSSYFNNPAPAFSGMGMGLNLNPPSNFGSPGTRSGYFG